MATQTHEMQSAGSLSGMGGPAATQGSGWMSQLGHPAGVNVNESERTASTLFGGLLMLLGLTRGSLGGTMMALLGGSLLYRGMTGHCHMYQALGMNTAKNSR